MEEVAVDLPIIHEPSVSDWRRLFRRSWIALLGIYSRREIAKFHKQVILEGAYTPTIDVAISAGWLASAETFFEKVLGVASSMSGQLVIG